MHRLQLCAPHTFLSTHGHLVARKAASSSAVAEAVAASPSAGRTGAKCTEPCRPMASRGALPPAAPAGPSSVGCGEPTRECQAFRVLESLLSCLLGLLGLLQLGLTLRGVLHSSSPCAGATFALLWRSLRRCESSPSPSGVWLSRPPEEQGERQDAPLPRRCAAATIMPCCMPTHTRTSNGEWFHGGARNSHGSNTVLSVRVSYSSESQLCNDSSLSLLTISVLID